VPLQLQGEAAPLTPAWPHREFYRVVAEESLIRTYNTNLLYVVVHTHTYGVLNLPKDLHSNMLYNLARVFYV
jgi:hypothetical protein